jgi:hypothetical protein
MKKYQIVYINSEGVYWSELEYFKHHQQEEFNVVRVRLLQQMSYEANEIYLRAMAGLIAAQLD